MGGAVKAADFFDFERWRVFYEDNGEINTIVHLCQHYDDNLPPPQSYPSASRLEEILPVLDIVSNLDKVKPKIHRCVECKERLIPEFYKKLKYIAQMKAIG